MIATRPVCSSLLVFVHLIAGCSGEIGSPAGARGSAPGSTAGVLPGSGQPGGGTTIGGPAGKGPPQNGGASDAPGTLPLLRLTRAEYTNAVRRLFGYADLSPAESFSPEAFASNGFSQPPSNVGVKDARDFQEAAEAVAARAVSEASKFTGCTGAVDRACVDSFLPRFGRRIYRRPLAQTELSELGDLYNAALGEGAEPTVALRTVVESMLQSPDFLLKWEIGPQKPAASSGVVPLTQYQLASRLSFLLSQEPPDEVLNQEVDQGKLQSAADVLRVTRRYLQNRKAKGQLFEGFHRAYLGLDRLADVRKDASLYPYWSTELVGGLEQEVRYFLQSVFLDGDNRLTTLLTAPYAFANEHTAPLYGLKLAGTTMQRIDLDPTQRRGILTQAAFMALTGGEAQSLPPKRGEKVWKKVLCGTMGPLPMDIPPLDKPLPGQTMRQRFEDHHSLATCARGCHLIIDPLGFAFEHFAGGGDYRTMDNGQPVDAHGELGTPGGGTLRFANATELVEQLSQQAEVAECVTKQWYRFALGRMEADGEIADLDELSATFVSAQTDENLLIENIVQSRGFMTRTLTDGETW